MTTDHSFAFARQGDNTAPADLLGHRAFVHGKAENKPLAALNFVMERAKQMGLSANQEAYAEIRQQKETDEKALAETAD